MEIIKPVRERDVPEHEAALLNSVVGKEHSRQKEKP